MAMKMILILAVALIFVPPPFDFNDLLHLAFSLSGFTLLIWWIIKNDQKNDETAAAIHHPELGVKRAPSLAA
jgi:hypothetical protein